MAFNAPDPAPNLGNHRQPCDDKVNHTYPQLCSSWRNCRLDFANPGREEEYSLSRDSNPPHFNSRPCRNRTAHRADELEERARARARARRSEDSSMGKEEDSPTEDASTKDIYTTTADERSSREGEDNSTSTPIEDNGNPAEDEDNPTEDDVDELKGIFNVCRYCIASTEAKRWFKLARKHFVEKPPQRKENLPNKNSRYFLTRLCRLCEVREELLLDQLQHPQHNILPVNRPSPREQSLMARYPVNRCTCQRRTLYVEVRCDMHRKVMWDCLKTDVIAQKAENRHFLVNIEQNDHGQRVQSTVETQVRRNEDGLWRACRCGADPVATTEEAVVMQCMGCEGIVHFPREDDDLQPPVALVHQFRQNSMSTPHIFALA
jgi:hypothetical protein